MAKQQLRRRIVQSPNIPSFAGQPVGDMSGGQINIPLHSSVSPVGELVKGLVSGFMGAQEQARKEEDAKAKRELVKAQAKLANAHLDIQELAGKLLKNQMVGQGEPQPEPATSTPTPIKEENLPATEEPMAFPPTAADQALAAEQPKQSGLKSKMVGPGGLPLQGLSLSSSGPRISFGNEKVPMSADNQLWAQLLRDNGGDYVKAREQYNNAIRGTAGARAQAPFDVKANPENQVTERTFKAQGAAGTVEGRAAIEGTPTYQGIQGDISAAKGAGSARGKLAVESSPQFQETQENLAQRKRLGTLKGAAPQALADLQNTQAIVDELKGLSDKLITANDAPSALSQSVKLTGQAFARTKGTGELAAAYQDKKQAFTGILSRTLGGEKGVLTDRDITRIVTALPGFRDTAALKDFKNSTVQRLLDTAVEAKRSLIEGRPPNPEIRQSLDSLIKQLEGGSGEKGSSRWERIQ